MSASNKMITFVSDDGATEGIECPSCGFLYTHHESTTAYVRESGEDSESYAIVISGDGAVRFASGLGNPSSRRDAVVLRFSCEMGCRFDLQLIQHKGNTLPVYEILQGPNTTDDL